MLCTKNKIKFSLLHSKLLKIALLMMSGIFFTTVNANLPRISDQADEPKAESSYFLDIDNLQPSYDSEGSITHYIEKENPSAVWIVLPIKSSMTDYYKTVANVVAAEFHKRIAEHSLVPSTRFLIGKDIHNHSSYQLLGSAYKKNSFTTPIMEILKERDFDDYAKNDIYMNYNVEYNVGVWNYLGLPISPDSALLEVSKDNKLIRYDYSNSFQNHRSTIPRKCFCTSYFPISDYDCNIEYIKALEQELRSTHKEMLEKIIAEVNVDSKKYLEEGDLQEVNQAFNIINNKIRILNH